MPTSESSSGGNGGGGGGRLGGRAGQRRNAASGRGSIVGMNTSRTGSGRGLGAAATGASGNSGRSLGGGSGGGREGGGMQERRSGILGGGIGGGGGERRSGTVFRRSNTTETTGSRGRVSESRSFNNSHATRNVQSEGGGGGMNRSANNSPIRASRTRRTPLRNKSLDGSTTSVRRSNIHGHSGHGSSGHGGMDDSLLNESSSRISMPGGAGNRYARSATASRMNTTTTTSSPFDRSASADGRRPGNTTLASVSDVTMDDSSNVSLGDFVPGHSSPYGGGGSGGGIPGGGAGSGGRQPRQALGAAGSRNTGTAAMSRLHNNTVSLARQFLDEDTHEDDFNLTGLTGPPTTTGQQGGGAGASGSNQAANLNASVNFNMSQLAFPTITGKGSIFEDDQHDSTPLMGGGGRYDSDPRRDSKNIFASREDLREVDQSVNLMDVGAGKYESKRTASSRRFGGSRTSGGSTTRSKRASIINPQAMVDVFLGGNDTNTNDSPFNPKSKKFRNLYHPDDDEETCWERFVNCMQVMFKVLCSIPVLIVLCILGVGFFLIPIITEATEHASNNNAVVKTTPSPTKGPDPTPAPVAVPVPSPPSDSKTDNNNNNNNNPNALFSSEEVETRMAALEDILTEANFDYHKTAPASVEALSWMAAYDPAMMVVVNSAPVVERYAMAALYFAMHPDATAEGVASQGGLSSLEANDRQAGRRHLWHRHRRYGHSRRNRQQQQQRDLSSGGGSSNTNNWMNKGSICKWQGIDCNSKKQVIHLNVSHTNLQGSLPEELTLMTELIELDLSHNQIHGTLPQSYPTKLSKLEYVWLHANQIDGSLPSSIGDWTSVYHLDVSENKLEGSLPPTLSRLTQTRLLYMDRNQFDGSIPLQLGHMPQIEYLYLGNNKLTGELPEDLLSRLSTLVDLRLNDNALTGTIPPEIESLHRLEFLYLGNNKLDGELPDVFDRLHHIVDMDLHKNSFGGPLPESLGAASTLERLLLGSNEFTGSVPSSWLGLTSLVKLGLDHNKLTGEVPLCPLTKLPLDFISADCKSRGKSGITCDCCEECY